MTAAEAIKRIWYQSATRWPGAAAGELFWLRENLQISIEDEDGVAAGW